MSQQLSFTQEPQLSVMIQNLNLIIKGSWISFGWDLYHIQDFFPFSDGVCILGESYAWWTYVHDYWVRGLLQLTSSVPLPPKLVPGSGRVHCCLQLQLGIDEWKKGTSVLDLIWSDVIDSCCFCSFDKDNVHFLTFWRILSLSLFDFCQHQELNLQKVLCVISWLSDFRLWFFSLRF